MSKITSRNGLIVGTNFIIDKVNRTYELVATSGLVAKDGVTLQVIFSKFSDLWATAEYQNLPFPMNAIDALSGQYEIGVDAGGNYNGWRPLNDTTRNMQRDGGVSEYSASGELLREYVCIIGLGSVASGTQMWYQRSPTDAPTDFVFTDQVNLGVQTYGNADNGNFTKRSYFKGYCRRYGYKYTESTLSDTAKTATGPFIVNLLLSNEIDTKIQADDAAMAGAPYNGITVTYYTTDQNREIAGASYPFRVIINGNNATLEQIYTKIQYLLRQNSDIDSGSGSVIGKTASSLLSFLGDTLNTTTGVYIDNILVADENRIVFTDQNGVQRTNAYTATGVLSFNSLLVGAGSSYRLIFKNGPGSNDEYGYDGAITVKDADGNDIAGVITSTSIPFTFDWDGDTLGGPAGTDKEVVLVGVRPGFAKYAVRMDTLTRSKVMNFPLIAEQDRNYV